MIGNVTVREAARLYLALGFQAIPVRAFNKMPVGAGWQNLKLVQEDVSSQFSASANVGMVCGQSGWVVVDCDGQKAIEWAEKNLPKTPLVVISGSGKGKHLYYRWPVGAPVKKQRIYVPDLVPDATEHVSCDLYGDGSQVVMPPSKHPSGGVYRWERQDIDPTTTPTELIEQVPFFDLAWLPPVPPKAKKAKK